MDSTRFQQYRQVPSHEFSPLQTYSKLPGGAYVGQEIELEAPDSPIYRVAYYHRNTALPAVSPNMALQQNYSTLIFPLDSGGSRVRSIPNNVRSRANTIILKVQSSDTVVENDFAYGKLEVTHGDTVYTYYVWKNSEKDSDDNIIVQIDGEFRTDITANTTHGSTGHDVVSLKANPYYRVTSDITTQLCAGFNEAQLPAIPAGLPGVYFLAMQEGQLRLTASDSISRGSQLQLTIGTADDDGKVETASGVNNIIGNASDAAVADARFWANINL